MKKEKVHRTESTHSGRLSLSVEVVKRVKVTKSEDAGKVKRTRGGEREREGGKNLNGYLLD